MMAGRKGRLPMMLVLAHAVVIQSVTFGMRPTLSYAVLDTGGSQALLAYLPALGHERGIAAGMVSAMLVARSLFSMFSRLFLGPMVKAFGRRRLMVWSIALSAVALVLFALPLHLSVLIMLASIYGFAIGTCQPITMSWIAELADAGTRGLAMSLRLASNRLGQTLLRTALGALSAVAGVFVGTGIMLAGAAWSGAAVGHAEQEEAADAPAG